VLAGLVERVTYHNAENGFCVLRAKARGHRDMVTVVGHAATIAAGEWICDSSTSQSTHPRSKTPCTSGRNALRSLIQQKSYISEMLLLCRETHGLISFSEWATEADIELSRNSDAHKEIVQH
jgi:hypothetical protein